MEQLSIASPAPQLQGPLKSLNHYSCDLCYRRKVKCDKKNPCTYCVKHQAPCIPASTGASHPRKKRFPEAELLRRLRKYEAALTAYGADIDAILNDEEPTDNMQYGLESVYTSSPHTEQTEAAPSRHEDKHDLHWKCDHKEGKLFRDNPEGSSEDEHEQGPVPSDYGDIFENMGSALLFSPQDTLDLQLFHPRPAQIIHLWQVFLDNVHPLLKIVHAPSLQQQLLEVASDLSTASPALNALLMTIYTSAVLSITDDTCMAIMNERRSQLIARYTTGAQCAFREAEFLKSTNVMLLQAFVLYLYAMTNVIHPRSLFCFSGIAERIARMNGLHRKLTRQNISAFETEMRRRLWWQVVLLDSRAAELSAAGTSVLGSTWHTKLPLNIDESDFSPEAARLPEPREWSTDMIFFLVRCEVADFLRNFRLHKAPAAGWAEFGNLSVSLAGKLVAIDDFEKHLQTHRLKDCDPQIPLHALTSYFAAYSIAKMRIVSYRTLSQADRMADPQIVEKRRYNLIHVCVDVIEAYNKCLSNQSLVKFAWFSTSLFPFLAYVHLLFNIRHRVTGDLADRAWDAMTSCAVDCSGSSKWLSPLSSSPFEVGHEALDLACARLAVTAWEARAAGLLNENLPVAEPTLIVRMRKKLMGAKPQSTAPSPENPNADTIATVGPSSTSSYSTNMAPDQMELRRLVQQSSQGQSASEGFEPLPFPDVCLEAELAMFDDYWQTFMPVDGLEDQFAGNWSMSMLRF